MAMPRDYASSMTVFRMRRFENATRRRGRTCSSISRSSSWLRDDRQALAGPLALAYDGARIVAKARCWFEARIALHCQRQPSCASQVTWLAKKKHPVGYPPHFDGSDVG